MAQQETITLDIVIDEASALSSLDKAKSRVTALKTEETNLNKAFKSGQITQKEYAQETERTSQQLAVEQKTVKTLSNELKQNKAVTDDVTKSQVALDNQLKKAPQSVKNLSSSFIDLRGVGENASKAFGEIKGATTDAVKGINVAGVSIGDVAAGITTSAGLIGGAVALIGALGAAYAGSAEGARDLAFASDLASSAISLVGDAIGETVAGLNEETGQVGLFSQIVSGLLFQLDSGLASAALAKAFAEQELRQIQLSLKFAQQFAKDDERRAENARRVRDDDTKSLQERLEQTTIINNALDGAGKRTVAVLLAQRQAIIDASTNYEKNLEAQLRVAEVDAEIADKEEEINGKLTENVTARRNILKLIKEEADLERAVNLANVRAFAAQPKQRDRVGDSFSQSGAGRSADVIQSEKETLAALHGIRQTEGEKQITDNIAIQDGITAYNKQALDKRLAYAEYIAGLEKQVQFAQIEAAAQVLGSISQLIDKESVQYKAFATAQTLISTYAAATKAYEAAFVPPTVASPALGAAYAAAAIAQGLANIAIINGVQFAEGGYTGQGNKYDVAGVVHKGEYVAPKHVVESPQGQMHIRALESQRLRGYVDGGFVTNETVSATQIALITANAIRNIPPPVVGVAEVTKIQRRIEAREKTSRL